MNRNRSYRRQRILWSDHRGDVLRRSQKVIMENSHS